MDLTKKCREPTDGACSLQKPIVEKLRQIDLWSRDEFDVREWRDRLLETGDAGMSRILQWCSKYCGTISEDHHLPVVFRKFGTLQEETGVSADGFYGPLKRAEEAGFCLRINVHGRPGRRQLLILKFPEESALHAIARAKGATEQWENRDNACSIEWVLKALEVELEQRMNRATAEPPTDEGVGAERFGVCRELGDSLNFRERTSANQRSNLCESEVPSFNKDQEVYSGEKKREPTARSPNSPSNSNSENPSPFGRWLRNLLERFGLEAAAPIFDEIDSAFGELSVDPKTLKRLVTAKVARLQGDGYEGQTILAFLLEDVEQISAQCRAKASANGRQRELGFGELESGDAEKDLDETSEATRESENERPEQGTEPEDPTQLDELRDSLEEEQVEFWPEVLQRLKGKVRSDTYERFFADLVGLRDGEGVMVTADDAFTVEWVFERWSDMVDAAAREVAGDIELEWDVDAMELAA